MSLASKIPLPRNISLLQHSSARMISPSPTGCPKQAQGKGGTSAALGQGVKKSRALYGRYRGDSTDRSTICQSVCILSKLARIL